MEVVSEFRRARYPMGRDGTMHVEDGKHEKALRELGATTAAGRRARGVGWYCLDCGFRGWFRHCRCGSYRTVRDI
jgi:hypothetical protein